MVPGRCSGAAGAPGAWSRGWCGVTPGPKTGPDWAFPGAGVPVGGCGHSLLSCPPPPAGTRWPCPLWGSTGSSSSSSWLLTSSTSTGPAAAASAASCPAPAARLADPRGSASPAPGCPAAPASPEGSRCRPPAGPSEGGPRAGRGGGGWAGSGLSAWGCSGTRGGGRAHTHTRSHVAGAGTAGPWGGAGGSRPPHVTRAVASRFPGRSPVTSRARRERRDGGGGE